jgi:HEPN domain-containing protein
MKTEARHWLAYASDNLAVARLCLASSLWNPSLHNSQQTVEKSLKALRSSLALPDKRIHDIRILRHDLVRAGIEVELTEDEAELLDSVFVDSKYPGTGVLPDAPPDRGVCEQCVNIAARVFEQACRICQGES